MATFKSAERRQGLLIFIGAVLYDVAVCYIVARIFDKDDVWTGTVIAFLCLYALTIIFAIKAAIWSAIVGWFGSDLVAASMADVWTKQEFPRPLAYEDSPGVYLRRVSEDEDVPMHVRLQAAREHGAFDANRGLIGNLVWTAIYEKALKKLPTADWQTDRDSAWGPDR